MQGRHQVRGKGGQSPQSRPIFAPFPPNFLPEEDPLGDAVARMREGRALPKHSVPSSARTTTSRSRRRWMRPSRARNGARAFPSSRPFSRSTDESTNDDASRSRLEASSSYTHFSRIAPHVLPYGGRGKALIFSCSRLS